jgi:hypothetical protein
MTKRTSKRRTSKILPEFIARSAAGKPQREPPRKFRHAYASLYGTPGVAYERLPFKEGSYDRELMKHLKFAAKYAQEFVDLASAYGETARAARARRAVRDIKSATKALGG